MEVIMFAEGTRCGLSSPEFYLRNPDKYIRTFKVFTMH